MAKGQLLFAENIKVEFENFCIRNSKEHVVFICDTNTAVHCLPSFKNQKNVIVIPAGELSKNLLTYTAILQKLIEFNIDKSALIVNLGGGTVTDIGGFAASTYMRGVDFVNIPTTLLGMVDASIGGKTGIDFLNKKNYIGTFALPEMVFIFPEFLETLPVSERLSGNAEIVKTGIIANQLLFEQLEVNDITDEIISMTAVTKLKIVENDFRDKEERQLLNFGHTIGHAFESFKLEMDAPVHHGFAVAKGMMAEARIAFHLGFISETELSRIIACIKSHTHQTELTQDEFVAIKHFLFFDKKNKKGEINFSLPDGIGRGRIKIPVTMEVIQKSLFNDSDR